MTRSSGPRHAPELKSIDTWIFDLDNTLYPAEINLFAQVDQRMTHFIMQRLALPRDAARALQKKYYADHGTTLQGLMRCHDLEPEDYLDFVHDIDVSALTPDPELNRLLTALQGRKLIFTNGSKAHAHNVVRAMEIEPHFEAIFDSAAAGYTPKHEGSVFDAFIKRHAIDPAHAIMFDDIADNLKPAHDLGLTTVWIQTSRNWGAPQAGGADRPPSCPHADYRAPDLISFLNRIVC